MGKYDALFQEEATPSPSPGAGGGGKYAALFDSEPTATPGLPPPSTPATDEVLSGETSSSPLMNFLRKPSPQWLQPFEQAVAGVYEHMPEQDQTPMLPGSYFAAKTGVLPPPLPQDHGPIDNSLRQEWPKVQTALGDVTRNIWRY